MIHGAKCDDAVYSSVRVPACSVLRPLVLGSGRRYAVHAALALQEVTLRNFPAYSQVRRKNRSVPAQGSAHNLSPLTPTETQQICVRGVVR